MNEMILVFEIAITFLCLILANKLYGKIGLYVWLILSILLTSILSVKTIMIFSYEINLGIVPYVSNFICMNILVQKYGPDQTKKIVTCCVLGLLISYLLTLCLHEYPSSIINQENNEIYNNVFKLDLRISIALLITYIASIIANVELYYQTRKTKNKIWISNIISSIIIHFTDTMLFSIIAYLGSTNTITFVVLAIIAIIVKYVTSFIGTIAIYVCKNIED